MNKNTQDSEYTVPVDAWKFLASIAYRMMRYRFSAVESEEMRDETYYSELNEVIEQALRRNRDDVGETTDSRARLLAAEIQAIIDKALVRMERRTKLVEPGNGVEVAA